MIDENQVAIIEMNGEKITLKKILIYDYIYRK